MDRERAGRASRGDARSENVPLCRRRLRRVRSAGHAFFEAADAFAEAFHDFRNALSAKENQNNRKYNHPMKNAELTHELPPSAPHGSAPISTLVQSFVCGKTVLWVAPIG